MEVLLFIVLVFGGATVASEGVQQHPIGQKPLISYHTNHVPSMCESEIGTISPHWD